MSLRESILESSEVLRAFAESGHRRVPEFWPLSPPRRSQRGRRDKPLTDAVVG